MKRWQRANDPRQRSDEVKGEALLQRFARGGLRVLTRWEAADRQMARRRKAKEDNLQTLCWKCNRSKGAKDPT